jgi:hypothetical protein
LITLPKKRVAEQWYFGVFVEGNKRINLSFVIALFSSIWTFENVELFFGSVVKVLDMNVVVKKAGFRLLVQKKFDRKIFPSEQRHYIL